MRKGTPREPEDLRRHECLVYRGMVEVVLDRWTFEKDGERRAVDVTSRLCSDDRTWLDDAACAGAGVIRGSDLLMSRYLRSGSLVPVLTDWKCMDAPTVFAAYRSSHRNSRLVRVFINFLLEVFGELEVERWPGLPGSVASASRPPWFSHARGRHSRFAARKKKPGR